MSSKYSLPDPDPTVPRARSAAPRRGLVEPEPPQRKWPRRALFGAAAATGARLIVTGVLAELNRSRQGRIDGEDVDVVLRRLIDLVVAGAGASR